MSTQLVFGLSTPVLNTASPPIPQAAGWAKKYVPTADKPLLNLSQGVPGAAPDPEFITALGEAIKDPKSHSYGGILGEPALREAIAAETADVYGRDVSGWGEDGKGVTSADCGVTCGANMAFLALMMAICNDGDEVMLPTPWYFNQEMTCTVLSLKAVPVPTFPPSFAPTLESISGLITEKTRVLCLTTPNNPTGGTYTPELIAEIAEFTRSKGIALIVDETYRDFLEPVKVGEEWKRAKPHNLFDDKKWRTNVMSISSFSKSYKIPGSRLGMIIADPVVLDCVATVLDCMQINAPRPPQIAIAPLMPSLRSSLIATSQRYTKLLHLFASIIERCPGWRCDSYGAFYAFVRHPFEGVGSAKVAEILATKFGVVVLPASFFNPTTALDDDRYLRFAVANVDEEAIKLVEARLQAITMADLK